MNETAKEPLIGVINAGSSSLKFSFYEGERRRLTGQVDGIGAHPSASAAGPNGEKGHTPGSGYETADPPERGAPGGIAVGQREARRQATRGGRAPRRPRRAALLPTRPGHTGIAGRAGGSGAARTLARAVQSRADQDGDEPESRIAAGGMLRYRLSPHRAGGRSGI